jgi:hypothetical protein
MGYWAKLWQVVWIYIKEHPVRFIIEVIVFSVLSYFVDHVTGGVCLFKHGRLNIQDIS